MKIPKDIEPSGCGQRNWVNITFFGKTAKEVDNKIKNYFTSYHPMGYDTHVSQATTKSPNGYYFAKLKRWSSCD